VQDGGSSRLRADARCLADLVERPFDLAQGKAWPGRRRDGRGAPQLPRADPDRSAWQLTGQEAGPDGPLAHIQAPQGGGEPVDLLSAASQRGHGVGGFHQVCEPGHQIDRQWYCSAE
jgi:hypothetical protein